MRNGNIFTMKAVNDEKTTDLFFQLGTLLGVSRGSDGKYHLADLCTAGSINKWAKCKPFRYNSDNFGYDPNNPITANTARESAKASVCYGFAGPNLITLGSSGMGHAPYEYLKPRGRDYNEPFRLRDFDGYMHSVTAPIQHIVLANGDVNFGNDNIAEVIMEDPMYVQMNFSPETGGWDERYGVKINEIVESQYRGYYFALLIEDLQNHHYWLFPTTVKISQYNDNVILCIVPNTDGTNATDYNQGGSLWTDMDDGINEDKLYRVAVVASFNSERADRTPYDNNYSDRVFTEPRSLELVYGKDRKTIRLKSKMSLSGLNAGLTNIQGGSLSRYGTMNTDAGNLTVYNINNALANIWIETPSTWFRERVYCEVTLLGNGSFFIDKNTGNIVANGEDPTLVYGVAIPGAAPNDLAPATRYTKEVLSFLNNNYRLGVTYTGIGSYLVNVSIKIYRSSSSIDKAKDSITIYSGTITYDNPDK